MEKSELLDLISQYDIQTLLGLGNDEWCALTNNFEKEMIEKIIFYVGECCQDEPVDIIIQQQKKILESISIVFSNMYYDYNGNMLREDDFSAELSLKIKAKKYICRQQEIAVPTKEDNTPDYEALQQLVTDYSSACEKMNKLTNELQAKANNHSQLLDLLMEYEKEKEKCKNIEQEQQTAILPLVLKLIEVAYEEQERQRREHIYIYLSTVLESYRESLPKEIFMAMENIKKNKPVDMNKLSIQINNYNAPVAQAIGSANTVNTKEKEEQQ